MLSKNTIKYAEMLNYQGHRHPVIKVMVIILVILSDFESRKKTDEDPEKFLSTLGFNKEDRNQLLKTGPEAFSGRGFFFKDDSSEVLSLIGLTEKSNEMLEKYNVILNVFSSKKGKELNSFSTEDIIDGLCFTHEGKNLLKQMSSLYNNNIVLLYYHYFNVK